VIKKHGCLTKIFIAFLILGVILAAFTWYAQNVLIPASLKTFVIDWIEANTGMAAELDAVGYTFPKSLYLKNLTIFQKKAPDKEFIIVKRVNLDFLPLNLLKHKELIIPKLNIDSADINLPKHQHPINISRARLKVDKDSVTLAGSSIYYKDKGYNLSGKLEDFAKPKIDAILNSKDFDLAVNFAIQENDILLNNLTLQILNSKINGSGKILNYASNPNIDIKIDSERINLFNLNFGQMNAELKMQNGKFRMPQLNLSPYGGKITISLEAGLSEKSPPYTINLDIADVDLSKWKMDTGLKGDDVKGTLSSKFAINGFGLNQETIKGKGWISVAEGRLWAIPLLGSLAEFLGMPHLRKAIIKEVLGNFTIADKKIHTEDLYFLSDDIVMLIKGNMDFTGKLDANITASFSPKFMEKTGRFGHIASLLIDKTGRFVGEVKMTGTIKKAKFKFSALPVEKILKEKILEPLKNIFK